MEQKRSLFFIVKTSDFYDPILGFFNLDGGNICYREQLTFEYSLSSEESNQ